MAEPFLSEIRLFSFGFAPKGWALCNGQLLPINQNQALFSLLGTTYGGNGQTNFALPNLQGRVPLHWQGAFTLGTRAGQEFHTVTLQELPQHTHAMQATNERATTNIPGSTTFLADSAPNDFYTGPANLVAMNAATVSSVGGTQPHENRQPFLVLNYCIALQGIFPSPN